MAESKSSKSAAEAATGLKPIATGEKIAKVAGFVEPEPGKRSNMWRATTSDGQVFNLGGSTDRNAVWAAAQRILNAQAARAVRDGLKDPELKVTDLEPIGVRAPSANIGLPPNAGLKKIDLNRYIKTPEEK